MNEGSPWLNLNGAVYSQGELTSGVFPKNLNSFEQSTLKFCQDWLSGKEKFSLTTSGSTGTPKEIFIARKQMEMSAKLTCEALHLKPGYTALVCLDTKYIAGQMMLVRSLITGMNIVAIDPIANPFQNLPSSQLIDFAALVPYQVDAVLNSPQAKRFNEWKCVIVGGAPLEPNSKIKLQELTCLFYATYGMTETISHVALQRINCEHPQDYFETLNGVNISTDERGCLSVQADYIGTEKLTTNDLVELIDEKKFRWLGRWDNIINSGGVKVMPEKVERALHTIFDDLKLTNRFFVTGLPDPKLHQKVSLIIEGGSLDAPLKSALEKNILEKISRYEQPREIRFISNFKQTETGKVLRRETLNLTPVSSHELRS